MASKIYLLSALLFLSAPIAWPILEWYTVQLYDGGVKGYDMRIESLSDLGVDYRQVHPLKHHNVQSWRHEYQNANFLQAGIVFALAQLALLFFSRKRADPSTATMRTARFFLTVIYAGGMILMARIHGGPREKFWKIIGWHWNGMTMVAVAGNLNSILAAAASGQVGDGYANSLLYRAASALLGAFGLSSFFQFLNLGEWDYESQVGLWQRGAIYPVLIWSFLTGVGIIMAILGGSGAGKAAVKPKKN